MTYHIRFLSTKAPRNCIDEDLFIGYLLILKLSLLQGLWNRVKFVLPSFNENVLAVNQWQTPFSSLFVISNKILYPCENKGWYHLQTWLVLNIWRHGQDGLFTVLKKEWPMSLHILCAFYLNYSYIQYIVTCL